MLAFKASIAPRREIECSLSIEAQSSKEVTYKRQERETSAYIKWRKQNNVEIGSMLFVAVQFPWKFCQRQASEFDSIFACISIELHVYLPQTMIHTHTHNHQV